MTTHTSTCAPKDFNHHRDLIDACRRGDQKAQFQVYKLYYKAMYNISLAILKNSMEAEDIMQEAFLSAFENISTFSGTVSFGAWIKKIVINRSIDLLRRRSRIKTENIETACYVSDASADEGETESDRNEVMIRISEAIQNLTDSCRKIFTLYFIDGYDHEEISEILAVSNNTSRSMLSRARKKLSLELKDLDRQKYFTKV